jgi:hypothetical protein
MEQQYLPPEYGTGTVTGGCQLANNSYYQNSPADSGVMSPMTPLSGYTSGSTPDQPVDLEFMTSPEHGSSLAFHSASSAASSVCSSYGLNPSPPNSEDSACFNHASVPSPYYPMITSPIASADDIYSANTVHQQHYEHWIVPTVRILALKVISEFSLQSIFLSLKFKSPLKSQKKSFIVLSSPKSNT